VARVRLIWSPEALYVDPPSHFDVVGRVDTSRKESQERTDYTAPTNKARPEMTATAILTLRRFLFRRRLDTSGSPTSYLALIGGVHRLRPVILDGVDVAYLRLVWVEARGQPRPPLAQEIPALVESQLDRPESLPVRV
jgi:hypothetical protein